MEGLGAYVEFFDELMESGVDAEMAEVSLNAASQLNLIEAYHRAQERRAREEGE